MAIKTVNSANLAEYVAERSVDTKSIQNGDQMTEALLKVAEAKQAPVEMEAKETKPNVANAPDPGDQEPSAKKKNPVQPRIDELTAQKRELEEFAESEYEMRLRAERRIGELETELKSAKPAPQVKVEEEVEPDPSKYTDQKEFLKDWGSWNRKEALKEFNKAEANKQVAIAQEAQSKRIAAQIAEAKADLPDFLEVIEDGATANPFVPEHVKEAILDSDVGAYLAYHLRKHPEDATRIYGLSRAKAVLELGKLELKYTKDGKATAETSTKTPTDTATQSKAPPPPPRLKGAEGGIVSTNMAAPMLFKDYKRLALEAKRSGNRR